MNLTQCYAILGLDEDATLETLKKSYRRLAFKFHPDLNQADPQAAQKFQQINEAYIILQKELTDGTSKKFTARKQRKPTARPREQASQQRPFQQTRQTAQAQAEKKIKKEKVQQERQEKILQDLLKDPFAKKVYEDIFLKLKNEKYSGPDHSVRSRTQAPENKKRPGIFSRVQTWLHDQADIWETVYVAAQKLIPGSTVQITIKHPLTGSAVGLDIRLPYDFSVGRTLRLKKKGKNLGLFKGDLYLRFLPK